MKERKVREGRYYEQNETDRCVREREVLLLELRPDMSVYADW